jgi:Alpha-tubulin suppressor and related RCC1 domain-containing proteins
MDRDAGQSASQPHLRKSRWRTVLVLLLLAALICFALLPQKPSPNPPGFSVGPSLPPGKVTPQLSYNYGNVRVLISNDGSLWRWDTVPNGVISNLKLPDAPQRISFETNWCQVATMLSHAVALKTDGSLWVWGDNRRGGLAQPDPAVQTTDPIRIGSDTNWTHIAIGAGHSLALKNDGSLWAWGQNDRGQIGDGTKSNQFAVTQIGSDHDWSAVSAGDFTSYALKNDGSLWGWGFSNGPAGDQLLPRPIESVAKIAAISANDYLVLALRSDGTLWISGANAHVAASAYVKTPSPNLVQIGKDNDWSEIYAGVCCFFARKKDSSWWFSGMSQGSGQLPAPKRLPLTFDASSFVAKDGHAFFLTRDGVVWLLDIQPDTGKYATAVRKLKTFVNQENCKVEYLIHPQKTLSWGGTVIVLPPSFTISRL